MTLLFDSTTSLELTKRALISLIQIKDKLRARGNRSDAFPYFSLSPSVSSAQPSSLSPSRPLTLGTDASTSQIALLLPRVYYLTCATTRSSARMGSFTPFDSANPLFSFGRQKGRLASRLDGWSSVRSDPPRHVSDLFNHANVGGKS
jgi:hypothetical protein